MEIIERQGEGKFALATRSTSKGDLVHVAHPLICVPNIGRIRAGTVCCGCLQRISPSKEFLLASSSSSQKETKQQQQQNNNNNNNSNNNNNTNNVLPPFVCQGCKVATYCSNECREHNAIVHHNSGECGAMTLFDQQNNGNVQETDEETLVLACLISRAMIEGYTNFPLQQQTNKSKIHNVASAILGEEVVAAIEAAANEFKNNNKDKRNAGEHPPQFKQFVSMEQEIDFVRNQPRVSVTSLFPEFVMKNNNNNNNTVCEVSSFKKSCSIPPPPSPPLLPSKNNSATKNDSLLLLDQDQRDRLSAIRISYEHSFLVDEQASKPANCSGAVPSFISYCDLVSNAAAMTKPQLEYVERLRMRYFNLAKKKFQTLQQQQNRDEERKSEQEQNQAENSSTPQLYAIHQKPIDPLFFVHFFSAYASNSFGAFDPKTDKKISAGVYPDASYFNHSCAPNLVRRRQGRFECFYATKNIKQGEGLNIDYNASDSDFRGVEERREYLLMNYRFWCLCDRCNAEGKIREEFKKKLAEEKKMIELLKQKGEGGAEAVAAAVAAIEHSHGQNNNGNDDDENENSGGVDKPRHCESCNIGGYMRAMYEPETHKLFGFECRFCFGFVAA